MPVVDASVLVEYLAGGEHAGAARERLLGSAEGLWAPHLVDAEVGHVLRRAVLADELPATTARAALEDLAELPMRRAGHAGLLDRAWALRKNVSFYNALYVALAEALELPLVTLDARMATAPGVRARIHVIR
jgi:predicted nucleic acid-binding protein